MRKRLKKKLTNSYNSLNGAKRQRCKRKGMKCIRYEFIPIGERDRVALSNDEMIPDYSFASHWLIEAYVWEDYSQVSFLAPTRASSQWTGVVMPACQSSRVNP